MFYAPTIAGSSHITAVISCATRANMTAYAIPFLRTCRQTLTFSGALFKYRTVFLTLNQRTVTETKLSLTVKCDACHFLTSHMTSELEMSI